MKYRFPTVAYKMEKKRPLYTTECETIYLVICVASNAQIFLEKISAFFSNF